MVTHKKSDFLSVQKKYKKIKSADLSGFLDDLIFSFFLHFVLDF